MAYVIILSNANGQQQNINIRRLCTHPCMTLSPWTNHSEISPLFISVDKIFFVNGFVMFNTIIPNLR